MIRVYYKLKGTAIRNGGKYLEELAETEIEYLKELNAIPEDMIIENDVPDNQENRDLEKNVDIFLGGYVNENLCTECNALLTFHNFRIFHHFTIPNPNVLT